VRIESLEDLEQHEAEIVRRINELPRGGSLFLAHPFQLLADLGVELSEEVRDRLIRDEPALGTPSTMAYQALRSTGAEQEVEVVLRRLFHREGRP
jgi:hypothetical protein